MLEAVRYFCSPREFQSLVALLHGLPRVFFKPAKNLFVQLAQHKAVHIVRSGVFSGWALSVCSEATGQPVSSAPRSAPPVVFARAVCRWYAMSHPPIGGEEALGFLQ
eukprot:6206479-Pleurochrysis_carterae.AAC.2